MGRVKIPYYVVRNGNGYWQSKPAMRLLGFQSTPCGPDGPEAWAKAEDLNRKWREYSSEADKPSRHIPPRGSLAEAFATYKTTPEWTKKGVRTREEWERAWTRIGSVFGDVKPRIVTLDQVSRFREAIARDVSQREAHRCIKIWRALWKVAAALKYCDAGADPSLGVRNTEPKRRQSLWSNIEAIRLVKGAWRAGYHGLAAVAAVAWDSSLSPVDVRTLTPGQRTAPDVFTLDRAKTGRAAFATLSRPAQRVLDAYLAQLGAAVAPGAPMFRNRSGAPYSKDTLGDDFRDVRALVFGEGETRTLADFRRSGAIEALRGGASAEHLGSKLANDFATSRDLQRTYTPVDLGAVKLVDEARKKGRK